MTTEAPAAALDAAAVAAISDARDEPDWLRALRAEWWARAEATPWPSGQEEEWRRTSLEKLPKDAPIVESSLSIRCELDPDLAAAGVVFGDLRAAVRDHPELVQRYLGQRETLDTQAHFWALAHAAWTGGTFLYVPAGVAVDRTLVAHIRVDRPDVAAFPVTLASCPTSTRWAPMFQAPSPSCWRFA